MGNKVRKQNFKKEPFLPRFELCDALEDFISELNWNIEKGIILKVSDFTRGKSKDKLKEFLKMLFKKPNSMKNKDDYSGVYLFAGKKGSKIDYKYVGISQQIINRLVDQTCNCDKRKATWAYLMAKVEYNKKHYPNRKDITKDSFKTVEDMKKAIIEKQKYMGEELFITCTRADNPFLMHMAEPYIASSFSCEWNSFETH